VRWRAANPEKDRIHAARRRADQPEKVKECIKRWRAANPEARRAIDARWRAANPEKVRARFARRRAAKLNATHPDHSLAIETVLLQSAARLRGCLGIDFHLDHIVPLSRGGKHHHANLRVLPASVNLSKHNRLDSELTDQLQGAMKAWSPFLN
jgi:5-methylcytosine-specific restriction endonuclease McrA